MDQIVGAMRQTRKKPEQITNAARILNAVRHRKESAANSNHPNKNPEKNNIKNGNQVPWRE